jgi:hypothetical protein
MDLHPLVAAIAVHTMTTMSETKPHKSIPTVSFAFAAGIRGEMVYRQDEGTTRFAIFKNGSWSLADRVRDDLDRTLVPYSPDNSLVQSKVVLFPSEPADYGTQKKLIEEIQRYIHRYVDLDAGFELMAAYYVLFTWLYDGFNEVPYLRLKGDFGTGKTRFLQTVGALCYRPIFTSGASTVSPLFHMLDMIGGTLILDEADFRYSDEKAEMTKILNNGNIRGMPVLRSEMNRTREFSPRVFSVFGPKIIAMRGDFEDQALESRFITYETDTVPLRQDIEINLRASYADEALLLRNQLLLYRFYHADTFEPRRELVNPRLPARVNQIFLPLLSIVEDDTDRLTLAKLMGSHHSSGGDIRNFEVV